MDSHNNPHAAALKKVVLIEDDQLLQRLYQEKLEQDGYTVFTAQNGAEGFKLIEQHHPDVVLCDIMMPETTGLELLEMKHAAAAAIKSIPVIMLTNLEGDEYIQKATELGAVGYVIKSKSDPKDVVAMVEKVLMGESLDLAA